LRAVIHLYTIKAMATTPTVAPTAIPAITVLDRPLEALLEGKEKVVEAEGERPETVTAVTVKVNTALTSTAVLITPLKAREATAVGSLGG